MIHTDRKLDMGFLSLRSETGASGRLALTTSHYSMKAALPPNTQEGARACAFLERVAGINSRSCPCFRRIAFNGLQIGHKPTTIRTMDHEEVTLQRLLSRFPDAPDPVCGSFQQIAHGDIPGVDLEILVAGLPKKVRVEPGELALGYIPLMRVILNAYRAAGRRLIVGLAGVPGSGKSTAAMILAELWKIARHPPRLVVIGMDGWHLPNAELDRRFFSNPDGSTTPLRRRKGSPPSFDSTALAEALECLRRRDRDVDVPVYDRRKHEPVSADTVVRREDDIVLIEGNYLLLNEGSWAEVVRRIDLPLWLEIDPRACREGIIARHMAGGMAPEAAAAKYAENDQPNADIAISGRHRAAWIVRADADHRLTCVVRAESPVG